MILGLTEFSDFVSMSDIFLMFLNTSDGFTIFAPTNAAFEAMLDELEALDLDVAVGHHIIDDRALRESQLGFNLRFMTLSNTTLHSTAVVYGDRTLLYNPDYSKHFHPSRLIRYTTVSLHVSSYLKFVIDNINYCRYPSLVEPGL